MSRLVVNQADNNLPQPANMPQEPQDADNHDIQNITMDESFQSIGSHDLN